MAEYDRINQEIYDENTNKIWLALDAIRQDKKLKVTIKQIADLTGLHRNNFGSNGARAWVGSELNLIKEQRAEQTNSSKAINKQKENNLHLLIEQSKLEVLHWFTKYSESERELNKLRARSKRDCESLEWYKQELDKERKKKIVFEERVELLNSLLNEK